ncbi:MAG: response regulator transcription factor [Cyanobacteria bacterium J06597_16]
MCHILIVEDEQNLSAFITKGLKRSGCRTTVLTNGQQAIALSAKTAYDLILLDIGLIEIDGWAVLKAIRDRGDRIPIIIMTAGNYRRSEAISAGADDYIQKPFRFKDLVTAIRQHLPSPDSP